MDIFEHALALAESSSIIIVATALAIGLKSAVRRHTYSVGEYT